MILGYVDKSISSPPFPLVLELIEVKLLYMKNSRYEKSNYRPISVRKNVSKIFQNVLYYKISYFLGNSFSKYQTGFRKSFNLQTCLEAMIEKFKKTQDEGGEYPELLRDLPKAFDCLPHNTIMAKLHAFIFDKATL